MQVLAQSCGFKICAGESAMQVLSARGCAAGDACQYAHVLVKKKDNTPPASRANVVPTLPKPIGGIALPSKHALKSGAVVGSVSDRLFGGDDTKYETETFTIGGGEENIPAGAAAGGPAYAAVLGQGVEHKSIDPAAFGIAVDAGPVSEEELQKRKELRERISRSGGEECGICMDQVQSKGKQFGLLDGCNHVFCVECIREWRQVGQLDKSVKRSCPLCRCESHYVIPSSYVPATEEEKQEVVHTYKHRLKRIPCRNFDEGRGECPFGTSCFYEHRFRDGTLEEGAAPRFKMTEDGVTEAVGKMKLSDMLFPSLPQ